MHRMAESVEIQDGGSLVGEDQADDYEGRRPAYDPGIASDPDLMVYKISGAFFFGATAAVSIALDRIGRYPGTLSSTWSTFR